MLISDIARYFLTLSFRFLPELGDNNYLRIVFKLEDSIPLRLLLGTTDSTSGILSNYRFNNLISMDKDIKLLAL
jgi:hypothetical protein